MTNLVEIRPVVLEEKILNFVNVFLLFHFYLPLEKIEPLHLNKLESQSPKDALCKFGWNWPSGSWEEDENEKSLQTDGQTDRRTDDGQQAIRKAHLSFQLRWAKKIDER